MGPTSATFRNRDVGCSSSLSAHCLSAPNQVLQAWGLPAAQPSYLAMLAAERASCWRTQAARPSPCRQMRSTVRPVRAMIAAPDFAAAAAALSASLVAAGPLPLLAGGLAAAGLSSLAPPPPPPPRGLRKDVSVNLEGGKAPLNTHGVGRGGKFLLPPCAAAIWLLLRLLLLQGVLLSTLPLSREPGS